MQRIRVGGNNKKGVEGQSVVVTHHLPVVVGMSDMCHVQIHNIDRVEGAQVR